MFSSDWIDCFNYSHRNHRKRRKELRPAWLCKFLCFCHFNFPWFVCYFLEGDRHVIIRGAPKRQLLFWKIFSLFQNRSRQKILYLAALAAIALSILILIVWARGWTTIQAERKNGQQCSDDIAANRALAKFHLIINFNGYKLVLHYLYNLDFLFSPESLSCTHIFRANS